MTMHLDDSYSDGMCGWVEVTDPETGNRAKVYWSVTSEIDSQHAAIEEAKRQLEARR